MESFLNWLLEQAPVVVVGGAWIYTLYQDRSYHRDRADRKEEGDKHLFERIITAVTSSTEVMKANQGDNAEIKTSIGEMKEGCGAMQLSIELIKAKLNG